MVLVSSLPVIKSYVDEITSQNYDSIVAQAPLMFLQFYAPWCAHVNNKIITPFVKLINYQTENEILLFIVVHKVVSSI